MPEIVRNSSHYLIDGSAGFLIAGEMHYFRVPASDWLRRLRLFKEGGGNCISAYVPWCFHEPAKDTFVFADCPAGDPKRFIELCAEVGLNVLLRPGPYVYSELYHGGLPGWLFESNKAITARDVHGKPYKRQSVSYLHPYFLKRARKWYEAVCDYLCPCFSSRGGPVSFVQIDNELIGFHEWNGGWDHNAESMGFGRPRGRFPRWLRKRYGTIKALNTAYATRYRAFKNVRPYSGSSPESDPERRRVKDYMEFYFGSVAEYAATLVGFLRMNGVAEPVVHNSGNPYMNAYFKETVERLGEDFILGSDHYYNLGPEWDQNNPTPQYALKCFYSLEMLRLFGFPPTVYELPGGNQADWPPFLPEEALASYLLNTAFGMKGFSYYVFTGGGGNPLGLSFKPDYDYQAAIGADGEVRPLYHTQKRFHSFLRENAWLARAQLLADVRIGLNWDYPRSSCYFSQAGEYECGNKDAWEFLLRGLLPAAFCISRSPSLESLADDRLLSRLETPLVVPCSVCMAAGIQRRLVRFVKAGGKLILMPVIPYLDESFNPCTVLRDFLDGAGVRRVRSKAQSVVDIGPVEYRRARGLVARGRPEGAQCVGAAREGSGEVAWAKRYAHGGMVIWCGVRWNYRYRFQGEILSYLLGLTGCRTRILECSNPSGIWAAARSDGEWVMLFVMNLFAAPQKARVRFVPADFDTGEMSFAPMEVRTVPVKSG